MTSPTRSGQPAAASSRRPSRNGSPGPWGRAARGALIPVLALVVWAVLARIGLTTGVLPSPGDVASALWELLRNGQLAQALPISLIRAGTGLLIGVAVGTLLGLVNGISHRTDLLLNPTLQAIRALPVLALVPLFIVWFGIGELSKVLMIALAATFPVYVNVHASVSQLDRKYFELADTLGLSRLERLRRIVLPAALPGWFVGLRYSSGLALVILVISEQVNADSGLGYLMTEARTYFRLDIIVAIILVYGVLGVVSDQLVAAWERYALRWASLRRRS